MTKKSMRDSKALRFAIAGAALVPGAAQAGIIHYTGPTLSVTGDQAALDLNNDGFTDYYYGGNVQANNLGTSYTYLQATGSNTFSGSPLTQGTDISASVNTYTALTLNSVATSATLVKCGSVFCPVYSVINGSLQGDFPSQTLFLIGLSFYDQQQALHNGWASVYTAYSDIGTGLAGQVNILQYAYSDTPNATIQAGTLTETSPTSAAPEPASLAMMAFGAAGLAAMRARRKQ